MTASKGEKWGTRSVVESARFRREQQPGRASCCLSFFTILGTLGLSHKTVLINGFSYHLKRMIVGAATANDAHVGQCAFPPGSLLFYSFLRQLLLFPHYVRRHIASCSQAPPSPSSSLLSFRLIKFWRGFSSFDTLFLESNKFLIFRLDFQVRKIMYVPLRFFFVSLDSRAMHRPSPKRAKPGQNLLIRAGFLIFLAKKKS